MIDPQGINHVYSIKPTEDEYMSRVVILLATRDGAHLGATFDIDNSVLNTLVENFEIE